MFFLNIHSKPPLAEREVICKSLALNMRFGSKVRAQTGAGTFTASPRQSPTAPTSSYPYSSSDGAFLMSLRWFALYVQYAGYGSENTSGGVCRDPSWDSPSLWDWLQSSSWFLTGLPSVSPPEITRCLLAATLGVHRNQHQRSVILLAVTYCKFSPLATFHQTWNKFLLGCTSCFRKAVLQYNSEFFYSIRWKWKGKKRKNKWQRLYLKICYSS